MLKQFLISFLLGCFTWLTTTSAVADSHFVIRSDVQAFIHNMVVKHHFDRENLIALFSQVHIRPQVMHSIKAPLEAQPWSSYRLVFLDESHIRKGVDFWYQHQAALDHAEEKYGVPASIIVATIGVETKYGKNKGEYPVIDALSSIAFSSTSRAKYFQQELEEFLLLAREQHLNPLTIRGSYAGAMGQPQFMPSSYRRYAVSSSGSKYIDLSDNIGDIIASIANYYHLHGWEPNQPVAIQTMIQGQNRYRYQFNSKSQRLLTRDDLEGYGLYPYYPIPSHQKFKVIQLPITHGYEYWVGLNNFDVIKRYNPNNLYAMAVYQLSYYIASLKEKRDHG